MEIKRDRYLNKLISFMWDGQVKVITGIRRCGKSYLLRNLFRTYLLGEGVPADHILSFESVPHLSVGGGRSGRSYSLL